MKKFLISTCILTAVIMMPAFAADTYTGAFVESVNNKINEKAAPVIEKERELNEKHQAIKALQSQQVSNKQTLLNEQQQAQLEVVQEKQQQLKEQKDLIEEQKSLFQRLFSFK